MDSYIVSNEGIVRLDTTGSAFSGAKLAAIRSVVDSGSNIKLFKDGAVVADDNYTRAGELTLNNTTIGASVSTTISALLCKHALRWPNHHKISFIQHRPQTL